MKKLKMLRLGLLLFLVGLAVGGPPVTKTREEIEEYREFLEKSRTGDGVRIDSRMLANPLANIWENSGKFEGDIILDDWQVDALVTDYAAGRAAYIWPNTKWPNNTVIYEFGLDEFNEEQERAILDAITSIEESSCITFRRRTNENNYVLLTGRSDGCYAHIGFWAGRGVHTLNLARANLGQGCFWGTTIVHEWLHILGFFHMHTTHNRDDYVEILYENIVEGEVHNFNRNEIDMVSNLDLPYEYTSSMHYSSHAFSSNGEPTIVALKNFEGIMGQGEYVTDWDWLRLQRHYNCPGAWSSKDKSEETSNIIDAEDPAEE